MAYGEIKVDTVTFTDGGIDKSVSISGLVQNPTFSGNITVTGTISGNTVQGQTVSGATVTGTTANFVSGVFTTQISGATITGNVGSFTTITGGTVTLTSGVFASGTAAAPSVSIGTTDNGLYSPGTDQVAVATNGQGRLFVDASGNVGVGTSSVNALLEVNNSTAGGEVQRIEGNYSGSGSVILTNWRRAGGSVAAAFKYNDDSSPLCMSIGTTTSHEFRIRTADTDAITIDASQQVGIGTTSPASCLTVSDGTTSGLTPFSDSDVFIDSSGDNYLQFGSGSSSSPAIYFGDSADGDVGGIIYSHTSDFMSFRTNAAERARIDSSGRLGIGTTSPTHNLTIGSTAASDFVLSLRGGVGGFLGWDDSANCTILQAPNTRSLQFRVNSDTFSAGTMAMHINSSGNVGIGTSSPTEILHTVSPGGSVPLFEHTTSPALKLTKTITGTESRISFANTADAKAAQMRINWAQDSFGAFETYVPNNAANGQAITIRSSIDNTIFYGSAAGTERARIDSSGRLLVGTSSSTNTVFVDANLQLKGNNYNGGSAAFIVENNSNGDAAPNIYLARSAGAGGALVSNNYRLGGIQFIGGDGTNYNSRAARIECFVDGTPGADDMPGRLVFSTTADGASAPTERMRIDSSGRVGIGTTSPATTLDVKAPSASTYVAQFADSATTKPAKIYVDANGVGFVRGNFDDGIEFASNTARIYANGSERARIDSSGRLGIGTSAPSSTTKMSIVDATSAGIYFLRTAQGETVIENTGPLTIRQSSGNGANQNIFFKTGASVGTEVTAMTIDGSQRVGIGTTSPDANSLLTVSSNSIGSLRVQNGVGGYSLLGITSGGSGSDAYLDGTNNLQFRLLGTERARIDSSGRLGIGTSAPGQALTVARSGLSNQNLSFDVSGTGNGIISSSDSSSLKDLTISNTSTSKNIIIKTTNSSAVLGTRIVVDGEGRVGIGTTSPGQLLEVNGNIQGGNFLAPSAATYGVASNTRIGIVPTSVTNERIEFHVGTSERARIDSSGRLGIGTSSPASTLTVQRNGSTVSSGLDASTALSLQSTGSVGSSTHLNILAGSTGATGQSVLTFGDADDPDVGAIRYRHGDNSLAFATNAAEQVRIDSAGNVGIGTTSPSSLLTVSASTPTSITAQLQVENTESGSSVSLVATGTAFTQTGWAPVQDGVILRSSGTASGGLGLQAGAVNSPISFHGSNGDERARIDPSGRLLVGTSNAAAGFGNLQSHTTGAFAGFYGNFANDGNPVVLTLGKSRGNDFSTIVQSGDGVGSLRFNATDGTGNLIRAAQINCEVDGTPGTNDMPGRLVFSTTADGASSPTERLRIAQNGVITIQNGAVAVIGTLTDGATITPDFAADCNFTVTLGGSRTIANPTNITAGQSGSIFIVQDATGSRTLSWGSYWDFPGGTAPTLSTAANAVDRVDYIVRSSTSIHTVFTANYS